MFAQCNFDESEEEPSEDPSNLMLPPGFMNMLMASAGMPPPTEGDDDDEDEDADEDFLPPGKVSVCFFYISPHITQARNTANTT